jgi:hypothetical protein
MNQAPSTGDDLHSLTARTMLGLDQAGWLALPEDERKQHRKHAKPVNFGRLFGQGAAGLVVSAQEKYSLILDHRAGVDSGLCGDLSRFHPLGPRLRARVEAQRPHPDRAGGRAHP